MHDYFVPTLYHLGLSIPEYQFLYVSAAVTILIAVLRLAEEMIHFYKHPLEYLLGWANLIKPALYTLSILFTFVFATPCLCVYNWQWQTGAVAVFMGDNLSPEMACDWSLPSYVCEYCTFLSEDSHFGSAAGDYIRTAILHAAV